MTQLFTHPEAVEALAGAFEAAFNQGELATIGLEEELILIEPATLAPAAEIEWALSELADPRFVAEFRQAQIELVMPVCPTAAELAGELASARRQLTETLGGRLRILGAGTHPCALGPAAVTDRPRYQQVALDHPWAVRRGLPTGLHVHVGLGDPREALAVYNAARSYLPLLSAFAANSPFFEGRDSGLASSRLKLTEDMPRSGIPPAFGSWYELADFVSWGSHAGLFTDSTHLWWDLRLRPEYGTLEFRFADSQASLDAVAAIAAVCQALVAMLREQYWAGEQLPVHPAHFLAENRWLAVRDGLEAMLADPLTATVIRARDRLARLLLQLEPYAAALGFADELARAWALLARNSAETQRVIAAERGLDGLLEWLIEETEAEVGARLLTRISR